MSTRNPHSRASPRITGSPCMKVANRATGATAPQLPKARKSSPRRTLIRSPIKLGKVSPKRKGQPLSLRTAGPFVFPDCRTSATPEGGRSERSARALAEARNLFFSSRAAPNPDAGTAGALVPRRCKSHGAPPPRQDAGYPPHDPRSRPRHGAGYKG